MHQLRPYMLYRQGIPHRQAHHSHYQCRHRLQLAVDQDEHYNALDKLCLLFVDCRHIDKLLCLHQNMEFQAFRHCRLDLPARQHHQGIDLGNQVLHRCQYREDLECMNMCLQRKHHLYRHLHHYIQELQR